MIIFRYTGLTKTLKSTSFISFEIGLLEYLKLHMWLALIPIGE